MRRFGYIQCKTTTVLGRKRFSTLVNAPSRRRARSKRTWKEVVRIDLKKCNLSKDLAKDRVEWQNRIHVVDPNIIEIIH